MNSELQGEAARGEQGGKVKREENEGIIEYTPDGFIRPSVYMYKPRRQRVTTHSAEISWSACGSVSIAEAIAFRDALSAAIEDAQRIAGEA